MPETWLYFITVAGAALITFVYFVTMALVREPQE